MLSRDIVDELHHVYGLTNTCTTKETHFTALGKRAYEINYFDACLQQLFRSSKLFVGWRSAVNCGAVLFADWATLVNGVTQDIHNTTEGFDANGNRDRCPCVIN